jgi:AcrR family transcriptional regulator
MVSESSPRGRYHHGDLKRALIEAALASVERDGHEALSLVGLAEAAGVARSAPYRHFESRDALLAAVAAEGFDLLIAALGRAMEGRASAEVVRFGAEALLDFAEQRHNLFRLMFRSDVLVRPGGPLPELKGPADLAFRRFEAGVAQVLPGADDRTVKASTIAVWSAVFGFAVLTAEGRIKPFMREPMTPKELRARTLVAIGAMLKPPPNGPS